MISEKDRLIMEFIHNQYLPPVLSKQDELANFSNTCKEANEKIQRVILCPSVYDIYMSAARCLIAGATESIIIQVMSTVLSDVVLPIVIGKGDEFFDYIKILYSGIFAIGDLDDHRRHSYENIGEERGTEDAMMLSMSIAAVALQQAVAENKIDAGVVKEARAKMFTGWMVTAPITERAISVVKMKDDGQAMFAILLDVTDRVNHGDLDVDAYDSILNIFFSYARKMSGDDVSEDLASKLSQDALGMLENISRKIADA